MPNRILLQDGVTPLHVASFKGQKEVVQLLLRKGADVSGLDQVQYVTQQHMYVATNRPLINRSWGLPFIFTTYPLRTAAERFCYYITYRAHSIRL